MKRRQVRVSAWCPDCKRCVTLDEAQRAGLAVELSLELGCSACQRRRFTLSLLGSAPCPAGEPISSRPREDKPAGGSDTPAPRKASPPFQPLLAAEQPDARRSRPVPFAPVSEGEPVEVRPTGVRRPGGWWKRLSDRQQKGVLAATIVLFAVVAFTFASATAATPPEPDAQTAEVTQ